MPRFGKARLALTILVVCIVSQCANLFFKSWYPSPHLRVRDGEHAHMSAPLVSPVPERQRKLSPNETREVVGTTAKPRDTKDQLNTTTMAVPVRGSLEHSSTTSTTTSADVRVVVAANTTAVVFNKTASWCPDTPPFLEGPLLTWTQTVTVQELIVKYPNLEPGGRMRPQDCLPRQRTAIIIPYRNRFSHLHVMLNNIIPVLHRQQADVTFFVVEQALPETFNRGALLNVGYLEAEKLASFDCYIFHDVDLVPMNDHNLYRCGDNPRHFAVSMNKFGFKLAYQGYFGGVVGFTKQQFHAVNGCSNMYFGWGGEDDDLYERLHGKKYKMVRYDPLTARYHMIKHGRDKGNEVNPLRTALLGNALARQDVEGLNTIKYTVNSLKLLPLYTWINVSLNMTEIIQSAPNHTLEVIRNVNRPKKRRKNRV